MLFHLDHGETLFLQGLDKTLVSLDPFRKQLYMNHSYTLVAHGLAAWSHVIQPVICLPTAIATAVKKCSHFMSRIYFRMD